MPFDAAAARKAGYSDAEIADFLAQQQKFDIAAARKSGYSDTEILGFLSTPQQQAPAPARPAAPTYAKGPAQGPGGPSQAELFAAEQRRKRDTGAATPTGGKSRAGKDAPLDRGTSAPVAQTGMGLGLGVGNALSTAMAPGETPQERFARESGPSGGATISAARAPEATAGNIARGLATSFGEAFKQQERGLYMAFEENAPLAPGDTEARRAARVEQALKEIRQSQSNQALARPDIQSAAGNYAYDTADSVLQSTPAIVGGILAGGITANPFIGTTVGLGLAGGQTGAQAYGKYRERGATPGMAALGAGGEAAIEVGTELLPMGALVEKFGKVGARRLIGEVLGKEMAGEQLATFTQDAIDTAIANPNKSWADYWEERPDAAFRTGLAVLAQTGLIGGASRVVQAVGNRLDGNGRLAGRNPADTRAAAPGVRETAVQQAATPTPEDEASPLPTADITAGKVEIARATAGKAADTGLQSAGMPTVGKRVVVDHGDGTTEAGTMEDWFEAEDGKGVVVRLDSGKTMREYTDTLADAGVTIREAGTAEADAIDARLAEMASNPELALSGAPSSPDAGAGQAAPSSRPVGSPVADGGAVIRSIFGKSARITSTQRSKDDPLSKANPKSWHARSNAAVDMAPIPGQTFEQTKARIEAAGYQLIEAIDEVKNPSKHATGPHWHFVIGEGKGAPVAPGAPMADAPVAGEEAAPEAPRDTNPALIPADATPEGKAMRGPAIDEEWSAFPQQSGTLAIPRGEMPQIKAEHRGAMVNFMNARGVAHEEVEVPASSLKPTQAEYSSAKVEKAKGYEGGNRAILISADGHVLDGHHQWMAALDKGETVRAIRLDAPIRDLVGLAHEFPSSTVAEGASTTAPAAGADDVVATYRGQEQARFRVVKVGDGNLDGEFTIHRIREDGSVMQRWNGRHMSEGATEGRFRTEDAARRAAQMQADRIEANFGGGTTTAPEAAGLDTLSDNEVGGFTTVLIDSPSTNDGVLATFTPEEKARLAEVGIRMNGNVMAAADVERLMAERATRQKQRYDQKREAAAPTPQPPASTAKLEPSESGKGIALTGASAAEIEAIKAAGIPIPPARKDGAMVFSAKRADAIRAAIAGVSNSVTPATEQTDAPGQLVIRNLRTGEERTMDLPPKDDPLTPQERARYNAFKRRNDNGQPLDDDQMAELLDLSKKLQAAKAEPKGTAPTEPATPGAPQEKPRPADKKANPYVTKGERYTLTQDVDYLKAGGTYEVESTTRTDAFFRNVETGGRTSVKNYLLQPAIANGVMQRVSQEPAPQESATSAAETAAPSKPDQEPAPSKFAGNKLFTEDKVAAAKARMAERMKRLNSGVDPEMLIDGITIAGAYIEAGVRNFAAFAKQMRDDFGPKIQPYLLSFWEGTRYYPGLDTEGMTDPATSKAMHEMMLAEAPVQETQAEPAPAAAPAQAQREDVPASNPSDPVMALRDRLVAGERFATIVEARKALSEITGEQIRPGTPEAKRADETIEAAVVQAARKIAAQGKDALTTYRELVDLYQRQPNLAVRTSTSIEQQAYSTPVPLAYLASKRAGITQVTTVYEPSAGNGALLIDARATYVTANELNPDRAAQLRAIYRGAKVSQEDASTFVPPGPQRDVVIANPPFGVVKDGEGDTRMFNMGDGYVTREIDHAISLLALDSMKNDGRAVLIVGGINKTITDPKKRSDAYNAKAKREFYYRLYSEYNVTDHFTVAGELYAKQGAGWPVDVIVIEGRGKSALKLPAVQAPRVYDSWAALENEVERGPSVQPQSGEQVGSSALVSGRPEGSNAGGRDRGRAGRPDRLEQPAAADQPGSLREGSPDGQPGGRRLDDRQAAGDALAVGNDRDRAGSRAPDVKRASVVPVAGENERQVTYQPASTSTSLETLVPVNMQTAIGTALDNLQARVGGVDAFVADRLGYKPSEIPNVFSAEQVDALALAIDNMERGAGFIIGDQTGIGKGRVVAGIIRYALKSGRMPIFVTEKPNLYSDMYRDMNDIGVPEMLGRPVDILMTNAAEKVPLNEDGSEVLKTGPAASHNALLNRVADGDRQGVDVLFTTYSQLQSLKGEFTPRQRAIAKLAPGSILIFDESHNAGGQGKKDNERKTKKQKEAEAAGLTAPNRAEFARQIARQAHGVFFSSATYAKRPEVMDLYASTDMRYAVADLDKLADAIGKGGIPMQQIVASMLTEAGQYVRRERSFDGVEYRTPAVEVDRKAYSQFTGVLRAIQNFQEENLAEVVEAIADEIRNEAQAISFDGSIGNAGATSTNFTAIMHNLVEQMLLAMKAKPAAELAVQAIENGQKPVITVANTMGSFLEEYATENNIGNGQPMPLDFRSLLVRYLDRTRRLAIKRPYSKDKAEYHYITDDELGPAGLASYNEVRRKIEEMDLGDVPVSPVDYIRNRIMEAGYKVGEITGRTAALDYSGKTPRYRIRPGSEKSISGRRAAITGFNSGTVDAMILNQAGSTGLSLHASKTFKDQRPRVMIIAQAERNIDTHMQMLGRIHRTGQVVLPAYDQLVAAVPAEMRPAAVLAKKMASLNANTTGARGSAVTAEEIPDFMNEYGDEIAARMMEEDDFLHVALGAPLKESKGDNEGFDREDAARKVTGRLMLLPLEEQEAFYERFLAEYQDYLAQKEAAGESALEAKTLPLDARTIDKEQVIAPTHPTSPFGAGVDREVFDVRRLGKPMKPEQVMEGIADALGTAAPATADEDARKALEEKGRQQNAELYREQIAKFDAYSRAQLDSLDDAKKYEANAERFRANRIAFTSLMRTVYPSAGIAVINQDGDMMAGVVMEVEHKTGTKNPLALGSYRAHIAPVGASGKVTIPFSQLFTREFDGAPGQREVQIITHADGLPMMQAFAEAQVEAREKRTILTGNILAAFEHTGGKGQIVNFVDSEGNVRPGLMMKRGYDYAKDMARRPVSFRTPEQVMAWLALGKVAIGDGVSVERKGGSIEVITNASKSRGGKYFLDPSVRRIVGGDFIKRSNGMVADAPATRGVELVRALLSLGANFTAKTDLEQAREIVAGSGSPSAKQSIPEDLPTVSAESADWGKLPAPGKQRLMILRQRVQRWYDGLVGTTVRSSDGKTVRFNREGMNKTLRGGEELMLRARAIPKIIQRGKLVSTEPANRRGFKAVHKYAANVRMDGETMPLVVSVREAADGTFHYSLNRYVSPDTPVGTGSADPRASNPALEGGAGDVLNLDVLQSSVNQENPDLGADLQARLEGYGIARKVALRVVETLGGAAGDYSNLLIRVATDTTQAGVYTLDHEVVHALRDMGLINQSEWAVLSAKARRDTALMRSIKARYARLSAEGQTEEAVGDMFARYQRGDYKAEGTVARVFKALRGALEAIGNYLRGRGLQTAEGVMQRMASGEVGARNGQAQLDGSARRSVAERPTVVYHGGTYSPFSGPNFPFFVSPDPAVSESYATDRGRGRGRLISFPYTPQKVATAEDVARIARPIFGDAFEEQSTFSMIDPAIGGDMAERVLDQLDEEGFDAVEFMDFAMDTDFTEVPAMAILAPSAIGRGTYANDTRYSMPERDDMVSLGGQDPTWRGKMAEAYEQWRTRLQDRYMPLLKVQREIEQQTGKPLPLSRNPYMGEELMTGRIGWQLERLAEDHVEPLFDAMHAEGVTLDELETYLYARHAPERNARIAEINPEFEEGSGSGMTDIEARAIMNRIKREGRMPAMERLAERVDALRELALDTQVRTGLISKADADELRATYKHYVPLRGFKEVEDADPATADRINRSGGGINVRGRESKAAYGRRSQADSPLAYLIMQAEGAIVRGETNLVAQQFVNLAKANPDEEFWQVNKVTAKQRINEETGLVERYLSYNLAAADADWTVSAKFGGVERRVTMNRANPAARRLADSMRNLTQHQLDWVTLHLGKLNRWLSSVNTSYNPEFIITNAFRDLQTAAFNLSAEDVKGLTSGVLKDYRAALVASFKGETGRPTGEWGKWYTEFVSNGGRVSFNQIENIDEIKKRIARIAEMSAAKAGEGGMALQAKRMFFATAEWIDNANSGVENAVRLAVYKNARERGLSPARAASMAKNVTVNFNRRGTAGPALNAAYLFFNASVQGSARIIQSLRSPRVRKMLAGVMITGALVEMLNAFMSADDDDGEAIYDKIAAFDKERNIILMLPGGEGYLKIPMPYGYNVFWNAGRSVAEIGRRGGARWKETSADFISSVVDAFNPIGGADSLLNLVSPTVTDPIVDLALNRDFTGKPIMPEESQYGPQEPDSQRYWGNVSPAWKAVTDFLNQASGGDNVTPGAIDVSPETLEYLSGVAFGSLGSSANRIANLVGKGVSPDEEVTANDLPFARKLYGTKPSWYDKGAFYERLGEVEQQLAYTKGYVEGGEIEQARAYARDHLSVLRLEADAKIARSDMRKVRKAKREVVAAHERGSIDEETYRADMRKIGDAEKLVIRQFNSRWNAVVAGDAGE